ncbi:hypothetical protein M5K25_011732 [Dendrobium thyrsiflorum]|uniref:Uncharacterized protein n=1 Tax=Dendrobium thyrsiflorum TaxID=117978 RepID=A0ABD0V3X9_DENTH
MGGNRPHSSTYRPAGQAGPGGPNRAAQAARARPRRGPGGPQRGPGAAQAGRWRGPRAAQAGRWRGPSAPRRAASACPRARAPRACAKGVPPALRRPAAAGGGRRRPGRPGPFRAPISAPKSAQHYGALDPVSWHCMLNSELLYNKDLNITALNSSAPAVPPSAAIEAVKQRCSDTMSEFLDREKETEVVWQYATASSFQLDSLRSPRQLG